MFSSILSTVEGTLSIENAIICMVSSLVLGLLIAYVHTLSERYSKNFIVVLSLLPLLVQVVIMMVNGNLGTSVAILGAFSLIRFRSMPGTSRELLSIFFAMAVGLAVGMGQIFYAGAFTIFTCLTIIILTKTEFGEGKNKRKMLKIVIPENLDYENVFDDIFNEYMSDVKLERVKTTNMGSMYELTYQIILKKDIKEKEMIDLIRTRNGNLNIVLNHEMRMENEL